ncbi:hypothetical protein GCM10012288_01680 [Malaciobacter pacificus]|uniref:Outer membrane lipoprotein, NlpC/P60 family n=1 Tax=Malaciobacter pacificus TaxID=1080223 RepID=A0A5C2H974_9BACT|nr:NlpC/P60 family protein [Malaciobacter pacificus]QEP33424.1 outer membrane lipoprotein, NlpC/P60 family [Malaciobacter pacificus]GGD31347.1 hypothetical protein GCM10012288_01680 [Malaciobacter pacificus]
MIKKSYFFIPLLLIFTGCTASKSVADNSEHNINTNNNTNKEIIISYEEYQKLFKSEKEEKFEPIITPEEYKAMIEEGKTKKTKELSSNASDKEIKAALMEFYNEWKNVKYKFGGNSKKGIDCSAFTQRIFKEKFNVKIPRSTRTQVKSGEGIKKSQLQLGDLVFFKTGKYDRHVGVYMGDGNFMHASIKGIKFTKLNKPFYKKAYWTSRRILD